MGFTLTVDAKDAVRSLRKTPVALQRAVTSWLRLGGILVRDTMSGVIDERVRHPPSKNLKRNIRVTTQLLSATIAPDPIQGKYGPVDPAWIDQPTRPHPITPRNPGGILAFPMAGGEVGIRGGRKVTVFRFGGVTSSGRRREAVTGLRFAKSVMHPGTRGLRFIEATAAQVEEPLQRLLRSQVERELSGGA